MSFQKQKDRSHCSSSVHWSSANALTLDHSEILSSSKGQTRDCLTKVIPCTVHKIFKGVYSILFKGMFPVEDLLWYVEKQTLGTNFLATCTKYSPFVEEMLQAMYLNTSLESNLKNMRKTIRESNEIEPRVVEGEIWFDNMTSYINILKTILDRLALRIVQVNSPSFYYV